MFPAISPIAFAYLQIVIAASFNVLTVYMIKKAEGFTVPMPSIMALVSICLTQFLISRALQAGIDVGVGLTLVVVAVMVGSCVMGATLFGEAMSVQKIAGLSVAVIGVAIASLAK